jgi:hypothetical protein
MTAEPTLDRSLGPAAASRQDLSVAAAVLAWIGSVLLLDAVPLRTLGGSTLAVRTETVETARQVALGIATWAVLALLLRRETALVRIQTLVVVALATCVEYTFSPLLEAYVYRIGTVPFFVPPGHGLVYLAALALGRSALFQANRRALVAGTVAVGAGWALHGLTADRADVLGAFWFGCLLGFLVWGRSRMLYVGAFVVVSYLEILGTALGTWAWAAHDPVLGVVSQGNPPSGAAGGYGWFDLYAIVVAPWALRTSRHTLRPAWSRLRSATRGGQPLAGTCDVAAEPASVPGSGAALAASTSSASSCSRPLVASALPPNGPGTPSSEVKPPPASSTTGTSAAMS